MVSSHELGIEVESLAHESNQDPPVLPECERRFILNILSLSKPDTFVIAFLSAQPSSSQKPNFKSYEKEKTVEPCALTEDAGQDDIIFSGEVEIISKEQFVSNISQTIPRLKKIQSDSKIPDSVHQKIAEAVSLLKMDLNPAKDAPDQGDDMINVEVDHIDNEPRHTESPPVFNETIHDETPPASPHIFKLFKKGRQLNIIQWNNI
ncbi:hypothetical protein O181_096766 [Austropuccinia psidii MF-1]|uniref:Uncharacterized protein n=1 Tax=Austropuccinia psidii MF-1 TaxID=1389203 RepID=A0A9Q3J7P7_9BASI|nr:hypothetical protein [Austropuccinia psidii MF-1]